MDWSLTKTIDLCKLHSFDNRDPSKSNSTMPENHFFFLYFVPFIFPPPVSDYLLHFMVMALNANEVIPGPTSVSLFGMIISGAEQTVWDK